MDMRIISHFHANKVLFTRREGNPDARVTLARRLPWRTHMSYFFTQHVYKAVGLP